MIWPIVEHAYFGTTRYTTLSLSVIHVPGKPINQPFFRTALVFLTTLWPLRLEMQTKVLLFITLFRVRVEFEP